MSPDADNTKQEESETASPSATSLPRPTSNSAKKEPLLRDGGSSDDDDKPISLKKLKQSAKQVKKPVAKDKKEESDDEQKTTRKTKTNSVSDKVVKTKSVELKVMKKEKKVYELPGQKRDAPEERDSSRIFYETLYQQVPTSEMAQIWLMECGLLPANVAKQVFDKKQKKAQTLRSPAKSPVSSAKKTTSAKSVTVKKELSTATGSSKSVTVKKEQSAYVTVTKNKSLGSMKKRKAADESDEDGSDDDFEVISQPKKRKLAG